MSVATGSAEVRTRRCWFILLAVLVAASAPCQTANHSGQILGTVSDPNGKGIAGAAVLLSAEGRSDNLKRAITDAGGRYVMSGVAYGAYQLSVSAKGFAEGGPKLAILASATATIDFTLSALTGKEGAMSASPQKTGPGRRQPPAFNAAGVEGTIAPTGYSTGLTREETSVMRSVDNLDQEILSGIAPAQSAPDCGQEPELLKAAEAEPHAFSPNHALGVFYLGHGQFIRSVKFLKAANEASPANAANARDLALALIGARQSSDAVALLERMTENSKSDPALLRLLAIAYQETGDRQKSVAAYQQAARLDPDTRNQFDCGIGLIGAGASAEASALFASATASHPQSARLWMGLGVAQDLQQRKIEAIHSLLRAIDIDPEYMPSYSFLAGLADAAPEAEEQIRKRLAALVVTHPESAVAHYDYALALWKQRRSNSEIASGAEIESQLKLALSKAPMMARAHFQLGIVYADAGDFGNAESEFQKVVKLEPENAEAHYRLAQAYRRNRQPQLANDEIKKFLALRGIPGRDENSPEADLQKLGSHLSRQLAAAAPCNGASR